MRALHVGDKDVVWAGLRDLVFQIEDRRHLLDDRESELRRADAWEGRAALEDRLEIGLARRLLGAYEDWIEGVMRELGQDDPRMDPPRGGSAPTRASRRSR